MGPWELLISIGVAFPYIFVSQGMFPRDQDRWPSLDDYYLAHSRALMSVLLVPPVAGLLYNGLLDGSWPYGAGLLFLSCRIGIPLALILVRRPWAHRAGIAALCFAMFVAIFYFFG